MGINFTLSISKSRNSHLLVGETNGKIRSRVRICSSQGVWRNASEKVRVVVSVDAQQLGSVDGLVNEKVIHLFRTPLIQESAAEELLKSVQTKVSDKIVGLKTEQCFNIGFDEDLSNEKVAVLKWLLQGTYKPGNLGDESFIGNETKEGYKTVVVEVGPRLSFTAAWSANAVSICHACGLSEINILEWSRRYLLYVKAESAPLLDSEIVDFAAMVHDRMTEYVYPSKLVSFKTSVVPEEVYYVPVMEKGGKALEEINQRMGLAFDEQDLQYYTKLFKDDIKRDPTNVEIFDIAQSNSEHNRHWFFTRKIVDGQPMDKTLMQIVKSTLKANPNNSVIGFRDNSSAIKGFLVNPLLPTQPGTTSPLSPVARDLDILFTAETHNFPCAVAPFPGAETSARGRIRDTHATARGYTIFL